MFSGSFVLLSVLPQIRICKTLYVPLCHPYREENDTELIDLVGSWYFVMQNMDVHCTSILVAFDSCLRPVGTSVSSLTSVPSLTSLTSVPSVSSVSSVSSVRAVCEQCQQSVTIVPSVLYELMCD